MHLDVCEHDKVVRPCVVRGSCLQASTSAHHGHVEPASSCRAMNAYACCLLPFASTECVTTVSKLAEMYATQQARLELMVQLWNANVVASGSQILLILLC